MEDTRAVIVETVLDQLLNALIGATSQRYDTPPVILTMLIIVMMSQRIAEYAPKELSEYLTRLSALCLEENPLEGEVVDEELIALGCRIIEKSVLTDQPAQGNA